MYLIKTKHDNYDGFIIVDYESDEGFSVQMKEGESDIEAATNYVLENNISSGPFFVSRGFN